MSAWPDPSVGEIGGAFAGLVALLACIGKGFAFLLGWQQKREESRAAKLAAWQKELTDREQKFDDKQAEHEKKIEAELAVLRGADQARSAEYAALRIEHKALLTAHQLITSALRRIDPANPALGQAEEILKAAFPLDPDAPDDMTRKILAVRRRDDA